MTLGTDMSAKAQSNLLLIDQPVNFLSLETFAKQLFSTRPVGACTELLALTFLREQGGGTKMEEKKKVTWAIEEHLATHC